MVPCHLSTLVLRVPIPHMTAHGCSTSADGRPAIHPTMSAARMSPCPTMPPNVLASDKDPKRARAMKARRRVQARRRAAQRRPPNRGKAACAAYAQAAFRKRLCGGALVQLGAGRNMIVHHQKMQSFLSLFVMYGADQHAAGINSHHLARRQVDNGNRSLSYQIFRLIIIVDSAEDYTILI